jgi:hypothetical protein
MESSWKPTAYLRWEEKVVVSEEFNIQTIIKVLMQKWVYMDGSEEWREVPEVTEG